MKQTINKMPIIFHQKIFGTIFSAKINLFLFTPYISYKDTIVDLGRGGGYMLSELKTKCAQVWGVKITPVARIEAERMGINTVASIIDLPDELIDIIISNHALEHGLNP